MKCIEVGCMRMELGGGVGARRMCVGVVARVWRSGQVRGGRVKVCGGRGKVCGGRGKCRKVG